MVTGYTFPTDFPTTAGAFQTASGGDFDAFVTRLNSAGSALVYSTYLGGSGHDEGRGIAVDALGNAYVTGRTESTDFPVTAGAFQATFGGFYDAFVTKITEAVSPPPPTIGKVTGGGSIYVPGGTANFGFIVQHQAPNAPIRGQLRYMNAASRVRIHSRMFNSFVISGNRATFGGDCTNNGVPCLFTVEVQDNGQPGTKDAFTITVDTRPPEGGTLRSGNIQIHQ